MSDKTCDVKGCENTFAKKDNRRVRLTKKKEKGEKVAWIFPDHGTELEEKIDFKGG